MDESERFLDGKNVPCILVEKKDDLLPQNEVNNVVSLKGFAMLIILYLELRQKLDTI